MSIAQKLIAINDAKTAIAVAIEAKGVQVGAAPFADYADKIAAIAGTGGGGDDNLDYVRPADWLTLPAVGATEQVFHGLHAVFPHQSNFATVQAQGAYTVDWGDGSSPENYASGVTAYHEYDYSAISPGTACSRGYRQVIVTLAPQAGQSLSQVNLSVKHNKTTLQASSSQWLDIRLALNNDGTVTLRGSSWMPMLLEQFDWIGNNAQTSFSSFFNSCYSLQSVPNLYTGSTNNSPSNMFASCFSLRRAPEIDFSGFQYISSMFLNCYALVEIPAYDFSNVVNMQNAFQNCYSLRSVPTLNTQSLTHLGYAFDGCRSLLASPIGNTSTAYFFNYTYRGCSSLVSVEHDLAGASNCSYMFNNCTTLRSVTLTNTGGVTNFSYMFDGCYNLAVAPQLDTSAGTNFARMHYANATLVVGGSYATGLGTDFGNMYAQCTSLAHVPTMDVSSCVTTTETGTVGIQALFTSCPNLGGAVLQGAQRKCSIASCSFSPAAIVAFFNGLADLTGNTSRLVTITNNWGAALLTQAERNIALNKNWTITG
jgi:hypothetical protein